MCLVICTLCIFHVSCYLYVMYISCVSLFVRYMYISCLSLFIRYVYCMCLVICMLCIFHVSHYLYIMYISCLSAWSINQCKPSTLCITRFSLTFAFCQICAICGVTCLARTSIVSKCVGTGSGAACVT